MAEMLTPISNTSMYTFKVAGPHVLVEREVLRHMTSKAGYEGGEGIFVPGGSMANLVAMLIARNESVPEVRENGADGSSLAVYTSRSGHYSTRKNAGILGIGRSNVREVPTDREGRMSVRDLDRFIRDDRENGSVPVLINATAGTTVEGSFDPLRELAALAREHRTWLHVDGAFGGSILLSRAYRNLLDGVDLSDSFSWCAHKMMGVPLSCSVLLMRRKGLLLRNLSEAAGYLFQEDHDDLNPGVSSLQCGRRNDALKLWAAWKHHGDDGYDERIGRMFGLARYAARRIEADPDLSLALRPPSINVCFEVRGRSSEAICSRLDKESRLKIGHGTVNGRCAIRLVTVNPDLEEEDIDFALREIKSVAMELPPEDEGARQ
jgi:glutamate/tyrosine decarboxylase-like PLP-dependent enzyme